jgi:hypothetical protein
MEPFNFDLANGLHLFDAKILPDLGDKLIKKKSWPRGQSPPGFEFTWQTVH